MRVRVCLRPVDLPAGAQPVVAACTERHLRRARRSGAPLLATVSTLVMSNWAARTRVRVLSPESVLVPGFVVVVEVVATVVGPVVVVVGDSTAVTFGGWSCSTRGGGSGPPTRPGTPTPAPGPVVGSGRLGLLPRVGVVVVVATA